MPRSCRLTYRNTQGNGAEGFGSQQNRVLRKEYRRKDQYLCIEIPPFPLLSVNGRSLKGAKLADVVALVPATAETITLSVLPEVVRANPSAKQQVWQSLLYVCV